jgi:peptidoglycan/xylan/chitin deacetylase (PgdA/CDA1 family)
MGTFQYRTTLPLEDREVVLTFDDGPLPPYTGKVLDALKSECVKATFFVVGAMAQYAPGLLRREAAEGHTIGTHTQHHANLQHVPLDKAKDEILKGIQAVQAVLGQGGKVAPYFRFPYLDSTKAAEDFAINQNLIVWSIDFHASDWNRLSPDQVMAVALSRLEQRGRGIILLHDIHARTAAALPGILAELKKRGYKIVHVVPQAGSQSATLSVGETQR